MASTTPLSPTFYGHIASTQDALLLFEASLSGALNYVVRRPQDWERVSLIKSGNVFIYEEHSSGIKRWTDGVPWSPSRVLGNFLVYRELERPFPSGEKKKARKQSEKLPGISKQDTERSLIGSLIDSYGFKEEGLVKKTVSVTVGSVSYHLVSYYTVADVMNNKFITPSKDTWFQNITVRPDLFTKQNFRTPIDEVDSIDRIDNRPAYANHLYAQNGCKITNQTIANQSILLPKPPISYDSGSSIYRDYGISLHSASSEGLPQSTPNNMYSSYFTASPGIYPVVKEENYEMGGYRQQRYNSVIGIGSDGPVFATQQLPLRPTFLTDHTPHPPSSHLIDPHNRRIQQ